VTYIPARQCGCAYDRECPHPCARCGRPVREHEAHTIAACRIALNRPNVPRLVTLNEDYE